MTIIENNNKDIGTNVKSFWSYVNSKRKDHGLPSAMRWNDIVVEGGQSVVNLLADYFQTVYVSVDNTSTTNAESTNLCTSELTIDLVISKDEIVKKVNSLDISKGMGPDGIPNIVLKKCITSLVDPLKFLFNKSIDDEKIPLEWKSSFVTPVHKSGSKSDVKN